MDDKFLHIVMFSGGLDSTYLLWKFLSEGKRVHAHHVSIRNLAEPDLWKMQLLAVEKITTELKEDFDFEFSRSKHEWFCYKKVQFDTDIVLLHAQSLCMNLNKQPLSVNLGWVTNDTHRAMIRQRWENQVTPKLWRSLVDSIVGRKNNIPLEISTPLLDRGVSKEFILKNLPQKFIDLSWSCRFPINSQPCGKCHACKELKGE